MSALDVTQVRESDIAIVGAGPIGLELAVALKQAGFDAVQIDAGQIGQTIADFPPQTRFFSSSERIAIAGVPIPSADQTKCRREEYLAYLRSVVQQFDLDVQTYERVIDIHREDGGFILTTQTPAGKRREYRVNRLVLATGGTARYRRLGISGEDLPHVTHDLGEVHRFFRRRVLVVGGKNSAVESALRCYHAGADVTISYRREAFPTSVKYWLLPEIRALIESGDIAAHFNTRPTRITPESVTLASTESDESIEVPAQDVLLMIGYDADMSLFEMAGVTLTGEERAPVFNEDTMETDVPGVYVAGTASAGTQYRYRVYIENSHIHVDRIVAALRGSAPPPRPRPVVLEEA